MIFRRIKAHIEKENWFAVFIDFCIVVFGVFMGFQIQEWALEQDMRAAENIYLQRLHGEVEQLIEERSRLNRIQRQNEDLLSKVVSVLQDDTDGGDLTEFECGAIIESHIYSKPPADLSTLEELLSSGRFDVLRAEGVRSAIIKFTQSARRATNTTEAITRSEIELAGEFPDLIQLKTRTTESRTSISNMIGKCDGTAMKASQSFLNKFAGNRDRFRIYMRFVIKPVTQNLDVLHKELDIELGIDHTTEAKQP